MSEHLSRESTKGYLRQISIAVAILLVLYGIVKLLNFLSDLAKIDLSYYLWTTFQIIVSLLIIFIGFRVYSIAKMLRLVDFVQLWREARPQLLALVLGVMALLPAVNPIYSSYSDLIHNPISFSYKLDYRWNSQSGGSIHMYTTFIYSSSPYQILIDIKTTSQGWTIIPYEIDGSHAYLCMLGPAHVEIVLGMIENGDYVFKVLMSDALDLYKIHKTNNSFWIEEINAINGFVVQKNDFEKRLDGYKLVFQIFPDIDNETKDFVLERVEEIGGVIVGTEILYEGREVHVYFYYEDSFSSLRQIILDVAREYPEYMIAFHSNTGWYTLTGQYTFKVGSKPHYADLIKEVILQKGLRIYKQGTSGTYIEFYVSSADIGKTDLEIRQELINSILEKLGLKEQTNDFYVTY